MTRDEAMECLAQLQEPYEKQLSDKALGFYLKRFLQCDHRALVRAIDTVLDTQKIFPRWPVIREVYATERARDQERFRRSVLEAEQAPMTPAELHAAALEMHAESVARIQRGNGRKDTLARFLEHGAEVYAENAKRRAAGERELPRPSIRAIIAKVAAQVVAP